MILLERNHPLPTYFQQKVIDMIAKDNPINPYEIKPIHKKQIGGAKLWDQKNGGREYPVDTSLKKSKSTARYSSTSNFRRNCGSCKFFRANSCQIVEGFISKSGICKFYKKK